MSDLSNHSTAIKPLRVLVATLILFFFANVAFALIDPPVDDLVIFNRVMPGFRRFPYPRVVREQDGKLLFSRDVVRNLDILFPSHIISAGGKPKDEYRIILVGDSAAWGAFLPLEQTVAEQINQAQLGSCDHRNLVVYNLGYPGASALKDLMIISESVESYEPDLIIWFITMNAFNMRATSVNNLYAESNYNRLQMLEEATGFYFGSKKYAPDNSSFMDRTIFGRRGELGLLLRLHWFGLKAMSIGTDDLRTLDEIELIQEQAGNKETYLGLRPGGNLKDALDFNLLLAAEKISGSIPIVYVNEPIYIEENNPVRYNDRYPRWAYDQYRNFLHNISIEYTRAYLDMWDLLPSNEFSDTVFHRTVEGESRVVWELIPVVQSESCGE